ncbi:hypothetical protein BC937DRAFT_91677 [Endogone sp. FLAS-F59071]|nr:hypothetical protein BC937DRAFT_91677 [Endogone sp. FLAS-F59071]|eukprot:RUS16035.1 hypothetical protein BC937DRAFT_91677 [Endogone sp. FLAS-F59071]
MKRSSSIEETNRNPLERLFLHFNACPYKIYLLIDEYDAITNEYLDPADTVSYQQLRDKQNVLKAIFGSVKDHCSKEIERVLPLAMNDVTSGFNIRYDITLEPTYEHMCGLKKEDIRHALESIFTGREELTDEEKKISVDTHLEQMRKYYNGYKFRTTNDDGIYNTNLCLDYLQRLSMGDPLQLVDPNNELSESVLMFIGRHPDSILLLIELLVTKQIPFEAIRQNIRLPDLVNVDSQGVDFLKSFLFYFGALTFTDQPGLFRLPNTVITKTIIKRVLQLCNIQTGSAAFRNAEWIKLGNLLDDRELVTKTVFHVFLTMIPRYLNDTEVPVKIDGTKTGYLDLLIAETKPASAGARPKRFVFEFKSKGINFLELPNQGLYLD